MHTPFAPLYKKSEGCAFGIGLLLLGKHKESYELILKLNKRKSENIQISVTCHRPAAVIRRRLFLLQSGCFGHTAARTAMDHLDMQAHLC